MEGKYQARTWQELLKQIIRDPQERQHIARVVGVQQITIKRWLNKKSQPRDENVRLLVKAISGDYYQEFTRLLALDYPHLFQSDTIAVHIAPEPPLEFYTYILSAYANMSPSLYPQALYDMLLQQMIKHLDPDRRGLLISVMLCVPPLHGTKVHSLREVRSIATPPWDQNQEQTSFFLGAESLAGAVVTSCRQIAVQSREEEYSLVPVHWLEHEESVVASPLMCRTKIAGCVVASSILPRTFTRTRLTLLEHYTHLLSLACDSADFFDARDIELGLMPTYTVQARYIRNFGKRVSQALMTASGQSRMKLQEVQERVWQEIEEELLQLAASSRV